MKKLFPIIRNKSVDKFTVFDIVGFDVETYGNTNKFYMGGLYTEEEFISFYDQDDMIKEILSSKYNNKLISATNLGFDFNALFFNTKYWSKFKVIYSGSQMVGVIYQPTKHLKITFIDTFNYVPYSVKIMGEILGVPKLKSPTFLGRKPVNSKEEQELLIYNERDCKVTYLFTRFLQLGFNQIGSQLKMTVASTAMDCFRREFLKFPLQHEVDKLDGDEDKFYDFLFSGYYGGHTEAYKRGKIGKLKVYDINSLYPFVMTKEYPIPNSVRYIKNAKEKFVLDYYGISEVTISSPKEMKYPYLPRRYDDKLLFALGKWKGVYTHMELQKAVKLGYKIHKFHKCYIYKKTFFPFRSYVNELYGKRMEYKAKGSPMELVYKLLLNSLYGKFAQKKNTDIKFVDLNNMDEDEYKEFMTDNTHDKIFLNNDNKGFVTDESPSRAKHVIPIFSIYTTAMARDLLYDYIARYNAIYCDTDSIFTYGTIKESKALGGMKVEYDVIDGIIVKPKMYMLKVLIKGQIKHIIKLKGVPTRTKQVFMDILDGKPVTYRKFTKTKESIRRHMRPNTIIMQTKRIKLEDNKRLWDNLFDPNVLADSKARNIEYE